MSLHFEAVRKIYGMIQGYKQQGFQEKLLLPILIKKGEMILNATSKKVIQEILQPSIPHYNGAQFCQISEYHVEEEELILWSMASLNGPLVPEGTKRFKELFRKFYSEDITEEIA